MTMTSAELASGRRRSPLAALLPSCPAPGGAAHRDRAGRGRVRLGQRRAARYLDGLAGLFVGPGRPRPPGAGRRGRCAGSEARLLPAVDLRPSRRRSSWPPASPSLAPGDLNRVFFTTGGSEAVESAWKLARQYFLAIGQPERTKVIARETAYHGTTLGALSITGLAPIKEPFLPLLNDQSRHVPEHAAPRSAPTPTTRFAGADAIEAMILAEGPETVAAVYLEPVQNAGGCLVAPDGYFQRVREICDRHGVLLVSDEVICALRPARRLVRRRAARLPARHDHLRQGRHLRVRAAGRRDGLRPDRRSRSSSRPRPSSTASPSPATR